MKTIILLLSALTVTLAASSQDNPARVITSGRIVYEEKIKLEIKLEGDAAQFSESLPKEQVSNKSLLFNTDYSLYQAEETKKNDEVLNQAHGNINIRMFAQGGNDKTFSDLRNRKKTEQKEFMTRMFLIESDFAGSDWKLTGNNRTILGYNCQEAVRGSDEKKTSAWFTPSIPVSTGPAGYEGLPGLVLMANVGDGKRIITATAIEPDLADAGLIIKPKEGKKVTAEEYKAIVDEKMKEMGSEAGEGGAHVMIRIKN